MRKIMKKLLLIFIMLSLCLPVFAKDNDKQLIKKVSRYKNIRKAVKIMNNPVSKSSYSTIIGQNPTNNVINIKFMDLSKYGKQYNNFDALGWKNENKLAIYVNNKHKKECIYALSSLLAGMAIHIDDESSINEEIYAFSLEGATWGYYLSKEPKLNQKKSKLIERENKLNKYYIKSPENAYYIRTLIENNDAYVNSAKISNSYTDEELNTKLKKLYDTYMEIGYITGF